MEITKVSTLTGKTHTMDIPVTQEQLDAWRTGGELIQNALPELTLDQREFLISGLTPEEWKDFAASWEEDDDEPE